jgi:hypothetical protein
MQHFKSILRTRFELAVLAVDTSHSVCSMRPPRLNGAVDQPVRKGSTMKTLLMTVAALAFATTAANAAHRALTVTGGDQRAIYGDRDPQPEMPNEPMVRSCWAQAKKQYGHATGLEAIDPSIFVANMCSEAGRYY